MTSKVVIKAKGDIRRKWDGVPIEPSFNDEGYLVCGLTTDKEPPECSLLRPKLQKISKTRDKTSTTSSSSQFYARRAIFLTLAHSENKKDEIYTPDLQRMASALGTKACETEFIVVGYEHENIKMAIKMKSQVPVKRIVKKISAFFNGYSGERAFDGEDKRTYLEKAASIVAPLEPRDVDPKPLVFGDKTLEDLLRRIDNARRGQGASRNVPVKWFPDDMDDKERYEREREFVDDLVGADGSWAAVMRSPKNQKMERENLGLLRGLFDFFSREAASDVFSEEAIEDVSNGENEDGVDVVVNGKLEHHGTMGCTQDKYDQLVQAKCHAKWRDHKKSEESFMDDMRFKAIMTGRFNLRKTSDEEVLEFMRGEKRARAEGVKDAVEPSVRKSMWDSRRL